MANIVDKTKKIGCNKKLRNIKNLGNRGFNTRGRGFYAKIKIVKNDEGNLTADLV